MPSSRVQGEGGVEEVAAGVGRSDVQDRLALGHAITLAALRGRG